MVGNPDSVKKVLIIYNPDPFYNLDEQVCTSYAKGIADMGWQSQISTVSALKNQDADSFDLYVFCANTYNWTPNWKVSNYIKTHKNLKGKNVVAVTLGRVVL